MRHSACAPRHFAPLGHHHPFVPHATSAPLRHHHAFAPHAIIAVRHRSATSTSLTHEPPPKPHPPDTICFIWSSPGLCRSPFSKKMDWRCANNLAKFKCTDGLHCAYNPSLIVTLLAAMPQASHSGWLSHGRSLGSHAKGMCTQPILPGSSLRRIQPCACICTSVALWRACTCICSNITLRHVRHA